MCPICPDCAYQRPCSNCNGRCGVCLNIIMPGPRELGALWIARSEEQDREAAKHASRAQSHEAVLANSALLDAQNLFFRACCDGNLAWARSRLQREGVSVDTVGRDGRSSLYMACCANSLEVVTFLLESDAQVDLRANDGSTAFHYCCANGWLMIAR